MIAVENLHRHFPGGAAPAVDGVSFEAPAGAITSLLGPSGAGKSTVLRLVAGLDTPDSGRVLIDQAECTALPARERGVGFVFQSYALFPHMTVFENVAFGLRVRKTPSPQVRKRVDELLDLIQLGHFAQRFPSQLSGGQRQRVAFARALAVRPRVLLLDEPFGALDVRVRVELREWLRDVHQKSGVTTLLVTHDQEEALEVSEHVIVMFDGKVAQAGPPGVIYDRPASPQVACFIGAANRLSGSVRCGTADLGAFSMPVRCDAQDGSKVEAFVRSHDIRLKPVGNVPKASPGQTARVGNGPEGAPGQIARVERLRQVAGLVKVSVRLQSGQPLSLEMSRSEAACAGLREGDAVEVNILGAQTFMEDYQI